MDKSLVSVAMATYNGEKYLREQVESILEQSYRPIQVVVTDDCSTDGTRQILEEYQRQGKLTFHVNETRLGYVKNFEKAIQLCDGEFIALADQDDIWDKEKIEKLVEGIGRSSLIHSDAKLIDSNGLLLEESYSSFSKKMTQPNSFKEMLLNGSVTGCTSLCRREFLEDILPFPEGLYVHDKWMGIFAFLQGGLTYCDQALISYRQHQENNIGALNPNITYFERVKRALRNWQNINAHALRSSFIKEKKMIELVQLHGKLSRKDSQSIKGILSFYESILSGKNIMKVIRFFLANLSSFEKGKPVAQKMYFLSLILLVFFNKGMSTKQINLSVI